MTNGKNIKTVVKFSFHPIRLRPIQCHVKKFCCTPEEWVARSWHTMLQKIDREFQRRLYKELVKNYNPLERPVANDSQPLTVYFSLSLLQIMDVLGYVYDYS
ncbi:hypothetical protein STEG23_002095 [Scotinomys teguina]